MASDAQVSGLAGGGVVITGASTGIGKECALYLDEDRMARRFFACAV